jgi:hypothetical protein
VLICDVQREGKETYGKIEEEKQKNWKGGEKEWAKGYNTIMKENCSPSPPFLGLRENR